MSLRHFARGTKARWQNSSMSGHANPRQEGRLFTTSGNQRNIENLGTGVELNNIGKKGMLAGSLAIAGGSVAFNTDNRSALTERMKYDSSEQDVQSLISTRGDGVGYRVANDAINYMESQGDLVFALNRLRN